ncbi:MAG: TlpA family protein disulfide reductase [Deltaproteobacteria bacterium]|nr:TlpA family protein disulfide reductase [Deltaproteobacteria bacterium]
MNIKLFFAAVIFFFASAGVALAGLVNEKAPDIVLPDLSGKTISLSDFKGKVVFVDFWSTYCASCKIELPEINKLVDKNKGSVAALAISIDKKRSHVDDYLARLPKFSEYFHVLLDTEPKVMPAYNALMPSAFIIDKDGYVRYVHFGFRESDPQQWAGEVEELLRKGDGR